MIIVLKAEATQSDADQILARIEEHGLKPLYMPGSERTVLGAIGDERVRAWVALGTPLSMGFDLGHYGEREVPLLLVQGEHDEFGPATQLEAFAATLPGSIETAIVPRADHLFHGLEDAAVASVVEYIGRLVAHAP